MTGSSGFRTAEVLAELGLPRDSIREYLRREFDLSDDELEAVLASLQEKDADV